MQTDRNVALFGRRQIPECFERQTLRSHFEPRQIFRFPRFSVRKGCADLGRDAHDARLLDADEPLTVADNAAAVRLFFEDLLFECGVQNDICPDAGIPVEVKAEPSHDAAVALAVVPVFDVVVGLRLCNMTLVRPFLYGLVPVAERDDGQLFVGLITQDRQCIFS